MDPIPRLELLSRLKAKTLPLGKRCWIVKYCKTEDRAFRIKIFRRKHSRTPHIKQLLKELQNYRFVNYQIYLFYQMH